MKTLIDAIRSAWLTYWARQYANEASYFEKLAFEHNHTTAGDIALQLCMRHREKALQLSDQLRIKR